ncbi:MAG: FaeA/PapI family transcriptional regulator, partial [Pseudomonadota bacterium]|nr:FaeA/PapI family transcriptional regulator [Pseudomonadota bacterium]
MSNKPGKTPFPTKDQILEFVRDSNGPVSKREIARAFGIRGQDRSRLNDILRELRAEGELDRGKGRRFAKPGVLPRVT